MPFLSTQTASAAFETPLKDVDVYINGVLRSGVDVICRAISERMGAQPGMAELWFPTRDFMEIPVDDRDFVEVWVARGLTNAPKFRGYPMTPANTLDSGITVVCHDLRARLYAGVCSRNYNEKGAGGDAEEELGLREILEDIWAQYNAATSADPKDLGKSFAAVGNNVPGELSMKGVPFGEAIEQIVREQMGDSYRLVLDYNPGNTILRIINDLGRGRGYVFIGTDPGATISNQPAGRANVNVNEATRDFYDRYNYLTAEGAAKVIETATTLVKGWDTSIEAAVLADPKKYTERTMSGDSGELNANFDARALDVWKRFRIPAITDDGETRQRPPYRHLISESHNLTDANGERVRPKAFLVIQYASGQKKAHFDFAFEDDIYVVTKNPLYESDVDTSGASDEEIMVAPTAVFLNWAYVSHERLSVDINGVTGGDLKRATVLTNEYFEHHLEDDNYILSQAAAGEALTLTLRSGTNAVRNDTTALTRWGQSRLEEIKEQTEFRNVTLLQGEVNYSPGMRYYENYKYDGSLIIEVTYELVDPMATTLVCSNK